MAYAQGKTRNERLASAGLVAAVHLGIVSILLATFAGGYITQIVEPFRPMQPLTPDPSPPPPPTEKAVDTPDTSVVVMPQPDHSVVPFDPANTIIPDTGINDKVTVIVPTGPIGTGIDPSPSPTSSFIPRVASPKTNPGTWATTLDYPPRAIREGRQGVTAFRVTVGTDGKVSDCMIIRSSGSQDLDDATCAKVSKRAKFEPATDSSGNKVTGSYANSIRWQLPE